MALVSVMMLGCGGGEGSGGDDPGGSGSSSIAVAYTPSPINAHAMQGYPAPITIRATLSPEPTAAVFPMIVASKPDIQTGSVYVERNPDGTYSTTLYTSSSLSIGVHEGTLTLRLYKDAQHTQQYALSGATVPYSITVEPLVSLTVRQGGVAITPGYGGYLVTSGQEVAITSNLPVTWDIGGGMTATLSSVSQTETTWNVILTGSSGWRDVVARSLGYAANSRSIPLTIAHQ